MSTKVGSNLECERGGGFLVGKAKALSEHSCWQPNQVFMTDMDTTHGRKQSTHNSLVSVHFEIFLVSSIIYAVSSILMIIPVMPLAKERIKKGTRNALIFASGVGFFLGSIGFIIMPIVTRNATIV